MKFIADKFMMIKKCLHFFNYPELFDRLIVLDGWSKTYAMTGWRLGWSVWPEKNY
jgi:aspartate aminotransferase